MARYPTTAEGCIDTWLQAHVKKGTLPKTRKGYLQTANLVIKTFRELKRSDLPYKWTDDDLRTIRKYWVDKDLAVKSQKGYDFVVCSIAAFYKNDVGKRNPIRWPHDTRPNVKWLNLQQARDLIKFITDENKASALEALCIYFMLGMGLRRVEVIRLRVQDIHANDPIPHVTVDGKGHKPRNVPFARDTVYFLERWLRRRAELVDIARRKARRKNGRFVDCDKLIIYEKGGRLSGYSELHPNGFDDATTTAVGIRFGLIFDNHTLRRTFGRELYYKEEDPIDLHTLAGIMGHDSTDETERYIGQDTTRMAVGILKTPY